MFQLKNNRLYPCLSPQIISFSVPEGMWINTDSADESENEIGLFVADKGAGLTIRFGKLARPGVEEEMAAFLTAIQSDAVPHPASYGGFTGCAVTEMSGREEDILLDISSLGLSGPDGEPADMIDITASADKPEGLKEAMGTCFAELLGSIRAERQA